MIEILSKVKDKALKSEIIKSLDRETEIKLENFIKSSEFARLIIEKSPQLILHFIHLSEIAKINSKNEKNIDFHSQYLEINDLKDPDELMRKIREIKNEEVVKLAMEEFLNINQTGQTVLKLSELADFCIDYAVKCAVLKLKPEFKISIEFLKENFIIIGMGKLGGEELNISSDVDLIFFGKDSVLKDESFGEGLKEFLIIFLDFLRISLPEGFLYRVDLRLRPEGEIGPLIMGTDDAIDYYKTRGRQWEMQALIKNRLVWGSRDLYDHFQASIEKIIYTHHDTQKILIEIKDIKDRIEKKIESDTMGVNSGNFYTGNKNKKIINIKLSPGGIRDIEFIIQFLQLIHGIRYPEIRKRNSMAALQSLKTFKIITEKEFDVLSKNYLTLRKIENILQFRNNLAEQNLPENDENLEIIFSPWLSKDFELHENNFSQELRKKIKKKMLDVRNIFTSLFDETIRYLKLRDNLINNYPDIPGELLKDHFLRLDSEYFLRFDEEGIHHHIKMIEKLNRENLVEISESMTASREWDICIVAFDYYYEFSKIAGLISANYLKIIKGESFTYCDFQQLNSDKNDQLYRRRKKQIYNGYNKDNPLDFLYKRKIVCIITAKVLDSIPDKKIKSSEYKPDWDNFKKDLNIILHFLDNNQTRLAEEFLNNRILSIIPRVPASISTSFYPVEIDIDNESSSQYTILYIKSKDSFAFLYTFTNVLALKNYYIFKIEIDTIHDMAVDRLFIMTRDGNKIISKEKIEELKITITLIKQYSAILLNTINPDKALRYFDELLDRVLESGEKKELPILGQSDVQKKLAAIFGISDFLWEDLIRLQYQTLLPILTEKNIEYKYTKDQLIQIYKDNYFEPQNIDAGDYSLFVENLNKFKDKEMFRIDMRQLLKKTDILGFAGELSELADAVIEIAIKRIEEDLIKKYSFPETPPWALFGLGKLGGRELGYASDVELMLIYDNPGNLSENQEIDSYFEKMLQIFLQAIHSKREGIFEIDLNLKPYGKSGKLAVSRQNFAEYFSNDGKAFFSERQSLVKMRFIASNNSGVYLREDILSRRDLWVYSGIPPDLDSLYQIRQKQLNSYVKNNQPANMKYSSGGLVEIEYIVQILQIRHGLNHLAVREVSTLEALNALKREDLITDEQFHDLSKSYIFLRNLINILRMVKGNAKDLTIYPENSIEYDYLVKRSFFIGIIEQESREFFKEKINKYRNLVKHYFDLLPEMIK